MIRRGEVVLLIMILLGACKIVPAQAPTEQGFEIVKNLDIFSNVIKELNTNYVDDIKPGELSKTAIDAMLESLDPYTNYITETEIEDYKFITTGEYGGIGALIHQNGDFVVISEPYEGAPAQKSDLRAGDIILEINGQSAKGKTYSDVSAILKGQAGTTISLKIQRPGESAPIEKTINREIIKIDNIPYYGMLDHNVGYIKLTSFTLKAASEVKQAFMKLREKSDLKGIIIDLRGNGGGLLNEAVDIVNLFVDRGHDVVTTKGKLPDKNHTYKTMNSPVDVNIPVIILVDGQSASASEILSGAMQDLDRGVVVGRRTFGKGLVQNVVPLSFNAQMKVTVAKYYIPSGRCIQAIDYSHKNKEGVFATIPDSLIAAFKTKDGRTVYEGRGIKPDIHADKVEYSNIAMALYTKYLIFDFATQFRREHPVIPPADKFEITDSIFNAFVTFISDKKYDYKTKSEEALEDLRKNSEKENYFNAIKSEYDALKKQMENDKKSDLAKFKSQICELIKQEIASRYYFQKGKIIASLDTDKDIAEAINTLADQNLYKSVLAGTYKSPVGSTDKKTGDNDSSDNDDPGNH
ncbi:MAG TPA: S41 family peptidase [Bacteroidales bacterium]|nr:S41 family peptidase [Bacteroidales bacterium]